MSTSQIPGPESTKDTRTPVLLTVVSVVVNVVLAILFVVIFIFTLRTIVGIVTS